MPDIPAVGFLSGNLRFTQRLAYGVGHVLNDLCASMWFSYLLLFFHNIVNFSNAMAGYVMLVGQVADAVATPFIGYESDRTQGCCGYANRKSWHIVGTVCVAVTFPFLFVQCIDCSASEAWAKLVYYSMFVVIFQFGWAATQINHLSLIPQLSPNEGERVELNAIRYAFTVISNILVYGIAWILLSSDPADSSLDADDAPQFRNLAVIVVGIGLVFSLIFHIGTKERRLTPVHMTQDMMAECSDSAIANEGVESMQWKDWFKEPQFYQVALLYMFTRLTVNIAQIYLPMYLLDTLQLNKRFIAIIPLVVYVSGFLGSVSMRCVNKVVGRKVSYLIGACLVIGACVCMYFLKHDTSMVVIGAAVLLGLGGATVLVTSLSITADLIGEHSRGGAFVYGAMSFTDKLSNGIAVLVIQHIHPCKTDTCCPACQWFYRGVISFVPAGCAAMAIIVMLTLLPVTLGRLRKFRGRQPEEQTALLGDERMSEMDCCDYVCCFGGSEEPQAKSVTQPVAPITSGTMVDTPASGYGTVQHARTRRSPVEYESIGS